MRDAQVNPPELNAADRASNAGEKFNLEVNLDMEADLPSRF